MRRLAMVAAVPLLVLSVLVAVPVSAETTVSCQPTSRAAYAAVVRREYAEPYVSRAEFDGLAVLRRCAASEADRRWMVAYGARTHRRLSEHRYMGRLWGRCANTPDSAVVACIRYAARKYGVDEGALISTANCESGRRPWASGGFQGMFQFLMSTWRGLPREFSSHSPYSARWSSLATAWSWTHGGRGGWPNC